MFCKNPIIQTGFGALFSLSLLFILEIKIFHWHFYCIFFYHTTLLPCDNIESMNHSYKPYCYRYVHKSTDNTTQIHSFCHLQLTAQTFNIIPFHSIQRKHRLTIVLNCFFRLLTIDRHSQLHKFSSQVKPRNKHK